MKRNMRPFFVISLQFAFACCLCSGETPTKLTQDECAKIKLSLREYHVYGPYSKGMYSGYAGGWLANDTSLELVSVSAELQLFDNSNRIIYRAPFKIDKFTDDELDYSGTFLPTMTNNQYGLVYLPERIAVQPHPYWVVITGGMAYRNPTNMHNIGHWFTKLLTGKTDELIHILQGDPKMVNFADKTGLAAIHFAALCGNLRLIKFLVSKGVDIKLKTNLYKTQPIHLARGDTAILEYLFSKGADPNAPNWKLYRPLHFAAHHGMTDIMSTLIKHGADVNARTKYGYTPLLTACYWRMPGWALAPLLRAGAKVNIYDGAGWTPLHHSARAEDDSGVLALIKAGANVNAVSKAGLKVTPLFSAAAAGRLKCTKALLEHGANKNFRASDSQTAADKARLYGHPDVAQLIDSYRRK